MAKSLQFIVLCQLVGSLHALSLCCIQNKVQSPPRIQANGPLLCLKKTAFQNQCLLNGK